MKVVLYSYRHSKILREICCTSTKSGEHNSRFLPLMPCQRFAWVAHALVHTIADEPTLWGCLPTYYPIVAGAGTHAWSARGGTLASHGPVGCAGGWEHWFTLGTPPTLPLWELTLLCGQNNPPLPLPLGGQARWLPSAMQLLCQWPMAPPAPLLPRTTGALSGEEFGIAHSLQ